MTESYARHTAPIAPSPMSSCSSNLPTRRYCSVSAMPIVVEVELCNLCSQEVGRNARPSPRAPIVDPSQQGPQLGVHFDVAPGKYPLRNVEEPLAAHSGPASCPPRERGDVLRGPHRVEHAGPGAHDRPGCEQRPDRRLGVVADETTQELETRFERRARDVEPDAAVRVLQVRRD